MNLCTCLYSQLLYIFYSLAFACKYFVRSNIFRVSFSFKNAFNLNDTVCRGSDHSGLDLNVFIPALCPSVPSVNFFVSPYLTWYLHPGSYILQSIIFKISICSQHDNDLMKSKFRSCWKQSCLWYQGRDLCNITTSLHCRNWSSSWWRQYSFDDRNSRWENATILLTIIMPFIVWNITVSWK